MFWDMLEPHGRVLLVAVVKEDCSTASAGLRGGGGIVDAASGNSLSGSPEEIDASYLLVCELSSPWVSTGKIPSRGCCTNRSGCLRRWADGPSQLPLYSPRFLSSVALPDARIGFSKINASAL